MERSARNSDKVKMKDMVGLFPFTADLVLLQYEDENLVNIILPSHLHSVFVRHLAKSIDYLIILGEL